MTSISASDYRMACADLINNAVLRPRMYFKTLSEFEAIIRGHQAAFEQLKSIDRSESFHECFSEWLQQNMDSSGAAGWAYAIEVLAEQTGKDPEVLFCNLVPKFLEQWEFDDTAK